MRQALHIFKKDVRHLRGEIILVCALTVIFAWRYGNDWTQIMLVLGDSFLIARVVHAEPIPGEIQFWITRPYQWKSLLGAKILFIAMFVSLSTLLAQMYILGQAQFPTASNWTALFWSQFLNLFIWLAIAALAALTSGMLPFTSAAFIVAAAAFVFEELPIVSSRGMKWPVGFEWVRNSVVIAAIAALAACVLYLQYKKRLTRPTLIGASGVLVLLAAAYVYLPPEWAMNLQSRSSGQQTDSAMQFVLAPHAVKHFSIATRANGRLGGEIASDLPFAVSRVPDDEELQIEAATILLQSPDGKAFHTAINGANQQTGASGSISFDVPFAMPASFFNIEQATPITLHASIYFTIFGDARTKTIPLQDHPADVMGMRCGRGLPGGFIRFACETPFRWPARLVYVQTDGAVGSLGNLLSYSPFPAGVNLDDSIEARWTTDISPLASHATVTVERPLAHLRRDLVIDGVRLRDITPPRF